MDENNIPLIPFPVFVLLTVMPPGTYGISYDVFTRATEDDLPFGWNAYRSATYKEIARILSSRDFERLQGSDWYCEPTDAVDTYWAMLAFKSVRPPGKLPSTLKGLKAHYIHDWVLDVTNELKLGGIYSPELDGPTPRRLVPQNVPSAVPDQAPQLPRNTQPSAAAGVAGNWRYPPAN